MENQVSSILVLKQKASSLKLAEQFLKNRGWELYFANSLKSLIVNLAQKQPQYLLLPIDFPHKKVQLLPNILAQAFPVKIIVYAENTTSASTAKLQEVKSDYRLYPPVSGPAVERMIFKIQRDEITRQEEAEKARLNPTSNSANTSSDFEIHIKQDQASARGALSALLKDDDGDSLGHSDSHPSYVPGSDPSQASQSGPAIINIGNGIDSPNYVPGQYQPGESQVGANIIPGDGGSTGPNYIPGSGGDLGPNYVPGNGGESGTNYIPGSNPGQGSGRSSLGSSQGRSDGRGQVEGSGPAEDSGEFEGEVPFYGNKNLSFEGPKRKSKSQTGATEINDPLDEFSAGDVAAALRSAKIVKPNDESSGADVDESSPRYKNSGLRGPSSEPVYRFKSKEKVNDDTIMVRGTQKALEESVYVRGGRVEQVSEVKSTKNSACIIVESPKFSGYLVAAMGSAKAIDASFIDMIRERLFSFLKAHGEVIQDSEKAMEIKLEEIEFDEWALDQAEFLKRAIHDDTEVAMAFFPSTDTSIKLEQSVSDKMLQMDISDLREDVALEFDLYIYLPENKKYLLYTPEGRPLYGNQKDRLAEKGVAKMHLRKESAHGVKRYRAQNFLNDKIAEFKNKKNKDKAI